MNLGALAAMAPLLKHSSSPAGDLDASALTEVAKALSGGENSPLASALQYLATLEPETKLSDLLGSESAKKFFTSLIDSKSNGSSIPPDTAFLKCPHCLGLFETSLK